ncbi:MAG TPA: hypothetical protein VFQ76_01150 [Longimicrobiaceae bacterium]|nr:hypothetical protein [Longimicrobiaceae bacterium]
MTHRFWSARTPLAAVLVVAAFACSDVGVVEPLSPPLAQRIRGEDRISFEGAPYPIGSALAVRIFTLNADGSDLTAISLDPGFSHVQHAWSPDGKTVAFVRYGASSDVYVMRADGSHLRRVTSMGHAWSPVWSPDGKWIAFLNRGPGVAELYVVRANGNGLRRLLAVPADSYTGDGPDWSPDGTRIAINMDDGAGYDIWVVAADGSEARNVTARPGWDYSPLWSPDGRRILFQSDRVPGGGYHIMQADGSGTRFLVSGLASSDNASWSPDGSRIVYPGYGFRDLYTLEVDSGSLRRLTRVSGGYNYPRWSPDGTRVVGVGEEGIFVVNADGSAMRWLTTAPYFILTRPRWIPDR